MSAANTSGVSQSNSVSWSDRWKTFKNGVRTRANQVVAEAEELKDAVLEKGEEIIVDTVVATANYFAEREIVTVEAENVDLPGVGCASYYRANDVKLNIDTNVFQGVAYVNEPFKVGAFVDEIYVDTINEEEIRFQWQYVSMYGDSSDWIEGSAEDIDGRWTSQMEFTMESPASYTIYCRAIYGDQDDVVGEVSTMVQVQERPGMGPQIDCVANCTEEYESKVSGYVGDILIFDLDGRHNEDHTAEWRAVNVNCDNTIEDCDLPMEEVEGYEGYSAFYFDELGGQYMVYADDITDSEGTKIGDASIAVEIPKRRDVSTMALEMNHYNGTAGDFTATVVGRAYMTGLPALSDYDWSYPYGEIEAQTDNQVTIRYTQSGDGLGLNVDIYDARNTMVATTQQGIGRLNLYVGEPAVDIQVDDTESPTVALDNNTRVYSCTISPEESEYRGPLTYDWLYDGAQLVDDFGIPITDQSVELIFTDPTEHELHCTVLDDESLVLGSTLNPELIYVGPESTYNCEEFTPPQFYNTYDLDGNASWIAGAYGFDVTEVEIQLCNSDPVVLSDCGVGFYTEHPDPAINTLPACGAEIDVDADSVYNEAYAADIDEDGTDEGRWWGIYYSGDATLHIEGIPRENLTGTNNFTIEATNTEGLTSSPHQVPLPYMQLMQVSITPEYISVGDTYQYSIGGPSGEYVPGANTYIGQIDLTTPEVPGLCPLIGLSETENTMTCTAGQIGFGTVSGEVNLWYGGDREVSGGIQFN